MAIESWARRSSLLHSLDPRAKLLALLAYLAAVSTAPPKLAPAAAPLLALPWLLLAISRLPVLPLITRAAWILPLPLAFAALAWLTGDPARGAALLLKSSLSALASLIIVSATPLPRLIAGFERLGLPRILALTIQLIYRYLFVLSSQAGQMRAAAQSRRAEGRFHRRFSDAAAGTLAVLFATAQSHAAGIRNAMLARGYTHSIPLLTPLRWTWPDTLFALVIPGLAWAPRWL
jgi:cobalt/nickel transport system permease protein